MASTGKSCGRLFARLPSTNCAARRNEGNVPRKRTRYSSSISCTPYRHATSLADTTGYSIGKLSVPRLSTGN